MCTRGQKTNENSIYYMLSKTNGIFLKNMHWNDPCFLPHSPAQSENNAWELHLLFSGPFERFIKFILYIGAHV